MQRECLSLFSTLGSGSHGAPPFFCELLASVALTLTADAYFKGLKAFQNNALFCNLLLSYYFYSFVIRIG